MSMRSFVRHIVRPLVPLPIRQLPWRVRWMKKTPAYLHAPVTTAARLGYWTIAECLLNRLKFTEGPFHFLTMPNNTCALSSYVAGSYEPELLRFLNSNLNRGGIFVDAGANIGFYTAYASRAIGPSGCVIAFEPHPLTSSVLAENITLNELVNVTIVRAALGNRVGELKMKYVQGDSGSTHVAVQPATEDLYGTARDPRRRIAEKRRSPCRLSQDRRRRV